MRLRSFLAATCAAAALSVCAEKAFAVPLLFTFTGDMSDSFVLSSNPTPDGIDSSTGDNSFYFTNYPITVSGSSVTTPYLEFYDTAANGGVTAGDQLNGTGSNYFDLYGPQLFTGSVSSPVFSVGVFQLNDKAGVPTETLTISNVPLPSSAPMFGAALFALGAVGYGLKRKTKAAA